VLPASEEDRRGLPFKLSERGIFSKERPMNEREEKVPVIANLKKTSEEGGRKIKLL